jgi:Leucine-rich repeat (LRR) protein
MKTTIGRIVAEKATIKRIDLSEQYSLTEVPEVIQQCSQLEKLDISFTGISKIPDFIFKLPKLKEFKYLGCNKLRNQPESFSTQQPLERLSIHVGQGQSICSDIRNLKNLKSLTISGKLKEIPKSIFNITNIEELEISLAYR